jgi:8-oxoguanine deaminase
MGTLLVRQARYLVTMAEDFVIPDGGLYAEDGVIKAVGNATSLPRTAETVIDARGQIVMPGMINTHHHFSQSMTRCTPAAQDASLHEWLAVHDSLWRNLTRDDLRVSARYAIAELLLAGCTTTVEHAVSADPGLALRDCFEEAEQLGIRFIGARGGRTAEGWMRRAAVSLENEDQFLEDCEHLIIRHHSAAPYSMGQIAIAPTNLLSVNRAFARKLACLSDALQVGLHTHLGETVQEAEASRSQTGLRPLEVAAEAGWLKPGTWFAHGIHLLKAEIEELGRMGVGMSHCPTSNMRMGAGVFPISKYSDAGASVGLGTDGAASNDAPNLLVDARMALLLARAVSGPRALTPSAALQMATVGGARTLNRPDLGVLMPGKAADFISFDTGRREFAGTHVDPVAALVLCNVSSVDLSVIAGQIRVVDGRIVDFDLAATIADHNRSAADLWMRSQQTG